MQCRKWDSYGEKAYASKYSIAYVILQCSVFNSSWKSCFVFFFIIDSLAPISEERHVFLKGYFRIFAMKPFIYFLSLMNSWIPFVCLYIQYEGS
jgi:hypothetical protein